MGLAIDCREITDTPDKTEATKFIKGVHTRALIKYHIIELVGNSSPQDQRLQLAAGSPELLIKNIAAI